MKKNKNIDSLVDACEEYLSSRFNKMVTNEEVFRFAQSLSNVTGKHITEYLDYKDIFNFQIDEIRFVYFEDNKHSPTKNVVFTIKETVTGLFYVNVGEMSCWSNQVGTFFINEDQAKSVMNDIKSFGYYAGLMEEYDKMKKE